MSAAHPQPNFLPNPSLHLAVACIPRLGLWTEKTSLGSSAKRGKNSDSRAAAGPSLAEGIVATTAGVGPAVAGVAKGVGGGVISQANGAGVATTPMEGSGGAAEEDGIGGIDVGMDG